MNFGIFGHASTAGQTASAAFRAWFGASKVVDAQGRPLRVYHGTIGEFAQFDPDRSGTHTKTGAAPSTFYFTDNADVAASYAIEWQGEWTTRFYEGGAVMPVYLRMQRPLVKDAHGGAGASSCIVEKSTT